MSTNLLMPISQVATIQITQTGLSIGVGATGAEFSVSAKSRVSVVAQVTGLANTNQTADVALQGRVLPTAPWVQIGDPVQVQGLAGGGVVNAPLEYSGYTFQDLRIALVASGSSTATITALWGRAE